MEENKKPKYSFANLTDDFIFTMLFIIIGGIFFATRSMLGDWSFLSIIMSLIFSLFLGSWVWILFVMSMLSLFEVFTTNNNYQCENNYDDMDV